MPRAPETGWQRVSPGRWFKEVSLTGRYLATRDRPGGRWSLHYEGGVSTWVGDFDTFGALKRYVNTR